MYKALTSFSGMITMAEGEVREIPDLAIVKDLLKAGYIVKVEDNKTRRRKRGEDSGI